MANRSSRQAAADGHASSPSRSRLSNPQSRSPSSPHEAPSRRMPPTLAPIKPIGFAQSREYRREGSYHPIPSPEVMGFDFKAIDEGQLRTVGLANGQSIINNQAEHIRLQVRDTISIKEQQQALIAARRREVAASTPATPKELTFKGWQPKDPDRLPSGGVGKRREKTRERVEGLTIITNAIDRDHVPGSKVSDLPGGPLSIKLMTECTNGPSLVCSAATISP